MTQYRIRWSPSHESVSLSEQLLRAVGGYVNADGRPGDEAKDAPRRIPRSMVLTVVINAVFAFAFIICLLFTLGDLETVLASPTGYPIIEVYYQATKSKAGTNGMMLMIIIVVLVSCFSILASVSRLTWAFAKDHGLPFADFFAYVSQLLWTSSRR